MLELLELLERFFLFLWQSSTFFYFMKFNFKKRKKRPFVFSRHKTPFVGTVGAETPGHKKTGPFNGNRFYYNKLKI